MEGDNRRGKKIADHTPHMCLESAAASKAKIPETNGPCLWSMLHVCHLYGHKMTSDQLYPTWRCFYSSTSHSASLSVCVCVASACANPWSVSSPPVPTIVCSFLSLFLSLLSLRIRWKNNNNHNFRLEMNSCWGVDVLPLVATMTLEMWPPSAEGKC